MLGACSSPATSSSPVLPHLSATRAAARPAPRIFLLPCNPPPRSARRCAARSLPMAAASPSSSSVRRPVVPASGGESDNHAREEANPTASPRGGVPAGLLRELISEALVWSSLHGLVVGHREFPLSATVPGLGMVHAPFSLLPMSFPRSHWRQACDLAPIFNELVDRVSLDGKFLQDSLSSDLAEDEAQWAPTNSADIFIDNGWRSKDFSMLYSLISTQ